MDKLISTKELFNTLNNENIPYNEDINYFILHAPEAIVRCKDCKWYYQLWVDAGIMIEHCYRVRGVIVKADGFCAWGKRREDGK